MDKNNSNYALPFTLEKIYGGEIMAQCINAAKQEIAKSLSLISFTTHYFFALQSRECTYKCVCEGGGQNLKFIQVEIIQENKVCVRTDLIFSRKESNELLHPSEKDSIKNDEKDQTNANTACNYTEYFTDAITKYYGVSKQDVLKIYKDYLGITAYFEKRSRLKMIDAGTVEIKFPNIQNVDDFCMEFAFVSDFIIIQCAANLLKFELHDFEKNVIFSLKQSMSFSEKINYKGACILKINLEILNSSKALVRGVLCDDNNEKICVLEQIVLFRKRK